MGTFGGLWIQHTHTFKIKAAFTSSGTESLSRYEKSKDLSQALEVVSVDTTYQALLEAQELANTAVERTEVAADAGINLVGNVVEIYVLDAQELRDALAEEGVQLPEKVVIVEVESLTTPAHGYEIHGGEHLTTCTSGFSVSDDDGKEGISTAGHCNDYQLRGATYLTPVKHGKWYGGFYDVRWYTADPAFTMRNLAYDGSSHRYIYSGRHRDNQSVGEYVCKYGKETGRSCGNIVDKNFKPGLYFSNTWIKVGHGDDDDFIDEGDSGGPWFVGNVAYGITSAGHNGDAVYMAINYIEDVGLSLITESE